MTEIEKQLLADLDYGKITLEEFHNWFPVDLENDSIYIRNEIGEAISRGDFNSLEKAISLIWLSGNPSKITDLLNELLINPNHKSHLRIEKTLQVIKSPTTVPYVKKALETNFDYLQYTFSNDEVLAKWFSWLLAEIGTEEAINLIREYSNSPNEGIKKEMLYHLKRIGSNKQPDPTSIKGTINRTNDNNPWFWPI
ncbi:MAG TPA: hypothetical protein VFW78_04300 [Bacteroidia bacterium]|nr:hypothetical protein [Bacteroidia bacterium]